MHHTHILSLGILWLTTISIACREPTAAAKATLKSQASTRHDLMEAKYSDEQNIYRAVSQDEWEAFKKMADIKLKEIDLQIALIDRTAMHAEGALTALYFKQINSLQQRNALMKSSISLYNDRQSEWAEFMQAFAKEIACSDLALQAFSPR